LRLIIAIKVLQPSTVSHISLK